MINEVWLVAKSTEEQELETYQVFPSMEHYDRGLARLRGYVGHF